jgi:putative intracellular protease/amidase
MKILLPLPERDFDPTEVSVPWRTLKSAGHDVIFATESGSRGACDPLLLTGVIFGQLGARPENVALYQEMQSDASYANPIRFADVKPSELAALVLPGGHAKGMRQYLESKTLHEKIAAFVDEKKLIGAICHGNVALVRSGRVKDREMTALPKWMERAAYLMTFWKLGDYYRTYPEYVEDEVRRINGKFTRGPMSNDYDKPFVVEDDNLVTARWPGDAKAFADKLVAKLS